MAEPREVIANVVKSKDIADAVIAELERWGFKIIRHRIVTDPPPKEWSRHGD